MGPLAGDAAGYREPPDPSLLSFMLGWRPACLMTLAPSPQTRLPTPVPAKTKQAHRKLIPDQKSLGPPAPA
jgi:hypothetical protein